MKEYVVVPQELIDDPARLAPWADAALAYGRSLPPKAKKSKAE